MKTRLAVMTIEQAADYIGKTPRTLLSYRVKGEGPRFLKDADGNIRYSKNDLDSYLGSLNSNNLVDGFTGEKVDIAKRGPGRPKKEPEYQDLPIGYKFFGKEKDLPRLRPGMNKGWLVCSGYSEVILCYPKELRWRLDVIDVHKDDREAQFKRMVGEWDLNRPRTGDQPFRPCPTRAEFGLPESDEPLLGLFDRVIPNEIIEQYRRAAEEDKQANSKYGRLPADPNSELAKKIRWLRAIPDPWTWEPLKLDLPKR